MTTAVENTSGGGSGSTVPQEVKGWSWGGFGLHWIWSIFNSVWIGLIAIVSPATLIMAIILGIKGREWAWQARKWDSVEAFKATQHKWDIAGIIVFAVGIAGAIIGILVSLFLIPYSTTIR